MSTYKGAVCLSKRTYRYSHKARMNIFSVEQHHTTYCRPWSLACPQTKRSLAAPLRHLDHYLSQLYALFRCLLHEYDGVYVSGSSLPSVTHTVLYWLPLHIITGVSSVGNVNTRLPVAVNLPVCTYSSSGMYIWGSDIWTSSVLQLYRTVRWWYTYGTYYVVLFSLVSCEVAHCLSTIPGMI